MGIVFAEDYKPKTEEELDTLIEAKQGLIEQQKEEDRIRAKQEEAAEEAKKKNVVILKDVDGDDVDQAEYFWPRLVAEKVGEKTPYERTLAPTKNTADPQFNKLVGMPVDREELIQAFVLFFPRAKGFLFYKARDKEVYTIIVPLKYAKTISAANESRPGDHQRHVLSFIQEGSVNVDSLKMKLERVARHNTISTEAIAR